MTSQSPDARRRFLRNTTGLLVAAAVTPLLGQEKAEGQEQVSANEDLMREHGLLRRILLVYDELARRIETRRDFPPKMLVDSANLVRRFVENYHERLEEEHLFPRFRSANQHVDLVETLQAQHDAGRKLTDAILYLTKTMSSADDRTAVGTCLQQFNRMYRPHAAREDTVLFPAFHAMLPASEYDAMGEEFGKHETRLFGHEGFEQVLAQVAALEQQLGIYDLSRFTPKV